MTVNSIPTQAVVDSGVISEELYRSFTGGDPFNPPFKCRRWRWHGGEMTEHLLLKIASKTINWEVPIALIHDSFLLGLNLMKSHDVVIHTCARVFTNNELAPSQIVRGDGSNYWVVIVTLRESTTIHPNVWTRVENPKARFSSCARACWTSQKPPGVLLPPWRNKCHSGYAASQPENLPCEQGYVLDP